MDFLQIMGSCNRYHPGRSKNQNVGSRSWTYYLLFPLYTVSNWRHVCRLNFSCCNTAILHSEQDAMHFPRHVDALPKPVVWIMLNLGWSYFNFELTMSQNQKVFCFTAISCSVCSAQVLKSVNNPLYFYTLWVAWPHEWSMCHKSWAEGVAV